MSTSLLEGPIRPKRNQLASELLDYRFDALRGELDSEKPSRHFQYIRQNKKVAPRVPASPSRQYVPSRDGTALVLFNAAAAFKIATSKIAMHLPLEWRNKLFAQVDSLLDVDEWLPEDSPPEEHSSITFLRLLLYVRPKRRPGLAASGNGDLVASWIVDQNRLVIRCLPNDRIVWSLTRILDGQKIKAAGDDTLLRVLDVLAAYQPRVWFD